MTLLFYNLVNRIIITRQGFRQLENLIEPMHSEMMMTAYLKQWYNWKIYDKKKKIQHFS